MFVSFSNSVGQVFILNWSLITNSFSFFLKLLDELVGDMVFIAAQFLIQFAIVLTQFEFLINLMAALSPWEANGSQEAESSLFSFWTFGSHVIPPHTTHPLHPPFFSSSLTKILISAIGCNLHIRCFLGKNGFVKQLKCNEMVRSRSFKWL